MTENQDKQITVIEPSVLLEEQQKVIELQERLAKQERIFNWEKQQLENKIQQLEEEVMSIHQQKIQDNNNNKQIDDFKLALKLYQDTEKEVEKKTASHTQRRNTMLSQGMNQLTSLQQFVQMNQQSQNQEPEVEKLNDRIKLLEIEVEVSKTQQIEQQGNLKQQFDESQSQVQMLENDLQILKRFLQEQKIAFAQKLENATASQTDIKSENNDLKAKTLSLENQVKDLENKRNNHEEIQKLNLELQKKNLQITQAEVGLQSVKKSNISLKRLLTMNENDLQQYQNTNAQNSTDVEISMQELKQQNRSLQETILQDNDKKELLEVKIIQQQQQFLEIVNVWNSNELQLSVQQLQELNKNLLDTVAKDTEKKDLLEAKVKQQQEEILQMVSVEKLKISSDLQNSNDVQQSMQELQEINKNLLDIISKENEKKELLEARIKSQQQEILTMVNVWNSNDLQQSIRQLQDLNKTLLETVAKDKEKKDQLESKVQEQQEEIIQMVNTEELKSSNDLQNSNNVQQSMQELQELNKNLKDTIAQDNEKKDSLETKVRQYQEEILELVNRELQTPQNDHISQQLEQKQRQVDLDLKEMIEKIKVLQDENIKLRQSQIYFDSKVSDVPILPMDAVHASSINDILTIRSEVYNVQKQQQEFQESIQDQLAQFKQDLNFDNNNRKQNYNTTKSPNITPNRSFIERFDSNESYLKPHNESFCNKPQAYSTLAPNRSFIDRDSSQSRLQKQINYVGDTVGFLKHGLGVQYYQDLGISYEGEWRFNKRHGYGELKNKSGEIVYRGGWLFDDMNGEGELTRELFISGATQVDLQDLRELHWVHYVGAIQRGDFHGAGVVQFVNGDSFEGIFQSGIPDGRGVFTSQSGLKTSGIWQRGKLIIYS